MCLGHVRFGDGPVFFLARALDGDDLEHVLAAPDNLDAVVVAFPARDNVQQVVVLPCARRTAAANRAGMQVSRRVGRQARRHAAQWRRHAAQCRSWFGGGHIHRRPHHWAPSHVLQRAPAQKKDAPKPVHTGELGLANLGS